ncbi:hypothetical protein WS67_14130 [Burkholderia singularis]|uniref:Flagellar hook-length control protein-like C-terminal domain-containing protein n=1 Tax=Burkholderia singularis TaxID=1503053 RepID=A0A124P8X6_9BURK|nr:flagellar hook-length control protein FliK [Burkholderia singularis]KVE26737.1 hypothetical protein WS67_14130 [Burkholderia singularis]
MPSLSLIGALSRAAGAAAKSSGTDTALGDTARTATFAQTLKQSVQSQQQANSAANATATATTKAGARNASTDAALNGPNGSNEPGARHAANAAAAPNALDSTGGASMQAAGGAPRTKGTGASGGHDQEDDTPAAQGAADAASLAAAALPQTPPPSGAPGSQTSATNPAETDSHGTLAAYAPAGTTDTSAQQGLARRAGAQPPLSAGSNAPANTHAVGVSGIAHAAPLRAEAGVPVAADSGPFGMLPAGAKQPASPTAALGDAASPAGAIGTAGASAPAVHAAPQEPGVSPIAQQHPSDAAQATLAASAAPAAVQSAAAAGAASTHAAASATPSLAPVVGSPDWTEALSQKVVFLSNAHQQSAELTLNPPDLGPLQVVLRVADNHAHALFVSQHAQVRDALEAALPKLREAMEANGLGLGSASVGDGGFAFAQQHTPQRQPADGGSAPHREFGALAGEDIVEEAAAASSGALRRSVGMIDTFA